MNLYFRLDANDSIGGGHLFRCMAYAKYFKKNFKKVIFIIRTTPKHLKNIISKNSFDFIELDINPENYSKSIEKIELLALEKILNKNDTLLIDHYYLSNSYKSYISNNLCKLIILSDDFIKNSKFKIINYSPFIKQYYEKTKNFYGLNYAPFNHYYTHKFRSQRKIKNYNLLISLGISHKNYLTKILNSISKINIDSSFNVFIPTTIDSNKLKKIKYKNLKIIIYKNFGDLKPLYKKIHIAIGAFGYSSLERLYCGVPQILMQTAKNQYHNSIFFEEYKLAYVLKKISKYDLTQGLKYLIKYSQKINISAPLIFLNNQKYIKNIFSNNSDIKDIINFTLPTKNEIEYLYYLQNLKNIRDFFINKNSPTFKEHSLWFKNTMNSSQKIIFILKNYFKKNIGFVQIYFNKKYLYLSILIDKKYHSKGFGTKVIGILVNIYSINYSI